MSLLTELKRRNVFRAGALYAAGAWAFAQGMAQLLPVFAAPEWITRWIVIAEIIGLPFWLAFAWFYELTPHGLKRESEVDPADSIARNTGRKMDFWIIGVLAAAVVLLLTDHFVARRNAEAASAIADKSIAVLPLANDSGDKNQQYFSDGLSEDLITALSQFEGLKVIGRESAFQFRDAKDDSRAIGQKLGVAHLLEGSVRLVGETVRVSAELINAGDGSTLWSQHYDRPYQDLFALQDEITRAVANALRAQLLPGAGTTSQSDHPPSGNLDAYTAYLQAKFYAEQQNEKAYGRAIDRYEEAIRIDPRYARAYTGLSMVSVLLSANFLEGAAAAQANARARAALGTALDLDPDLAATHVARGTLLTYADFDWDGAETEYRTALRLEPSDSPSRIGLGQMLAIRGRIDEGIRLTREALANDPRHANWHVVLASYLMAVGQLDEAEAQTRKAIDLLPAAAYFYEQLAIIEAVRGNAAAALEAAQREKSGPYREISLAMALQLGEDRAAADAALATLIDHQHESAAFQIAEVYAVRKDPDKMFEWLDRAWDNRDSGISDLLIDPLLASYRQDPRFAAICRKVGLPAPNLT